MGINKEITTNIILAAALYIVSLASVFKMGERLESEKQTRLCAAEIRTIEQRVQGFYQIKTLQQTTEEPNIFTSEIPDNRRLIGTTTDGTRHVFTPYTDKSDTNQFWKPCYTIHTRTTAPESVIITR
jgi:hypothetical protein